MVGIIFCMLLVFGVSLTVVRLRRRIRQEPLVVIVALWALWQACQRRRRQLDYCLR